MPKTFLVVAGSLGAVNTTTAVGRALASAGHTVSYLINSAAQMAFPSDLDADLGDINDAGFVQRVFAGTRPDVVISGLSAPTLHERNVIAFAEELCIPLVTFADAWGTLVRLPSDTTPTLALAFDPVEYGFITGVNMRTVMVGDPMYDRLVTIPSDVREVIANLSSGAGCARRKTILLAGQKGRKGAIEYNQFNAQFVADSLQGCDPNLFRVIVRAHPNMEPEAAEAWEREIDRIPDECIVYLPQQLATDHIAACVKHVVTAFGSSLRPNAHFDNLPFSVAYEASIDEMGRQMGFGVHPLVTAGAAVAATRPIHGFHANHPGGKYRIEPFNADLAVEAILEACT